MSSDQAQRLAALASAELTYAERGATRDPVMPDGYHHLSRDRSIGHGREAFERAGEGLFTWQMHRDFGFAVAASAERAESGVVVALRWGPISIPCRVVYLVDTPDRKGFGYGTLPGHPERGEESFTVELMADGKVRARVRAFSRPATLLARAGGPVTRLTQQWATNRYVKVLGRIANRH